MINKIFLSPDDDLKPAVLVWNEEREDYVFEQLPDNISRYDLVQLIEEVKFLTRWDD